MDGRRGPPRGALRAKGEGLGGFRATFVTWETPREVPRERSSLKSVELLSVCETLSAT